MLKPFSEIQLPADVLYLSFRAAVMASFDLMKLHFGPQEVDVTGRGPLETISILRGTAIQMQLQSFIHTWKKLAPDSGQLLTDVDLCVCYCSTTELARQTDLNREHHIGRLKFGPRPFPDLAPLWIGSRLRVLQLTWPFLDGAGSLLRSGRLLNDQIDCIPPAGDNDQVVDSFMHLLSQWHVEPLVTKDLDGLLTNAEVHELNQFFMRHRHLMNL